jgi:hypothetical protein
LKGHYLVRAEKEEVERGEEEWERTTIAVQGSAGSMQKRAQGVEEGKRDAIMERYDLLRRGSDPTSSSSSLVERDSTHLLTHARRFMLSLEPQVPRLRIKRDLPVLPPSPRLFKRSFLPSLSPRQIPGATGAAPGLVELMREKFSFLDPLWSKQWHLVNEVMQENSINVTGVWDQGIVGTGVNVAIVDDGLDMHSDDLAANFVRSRFLFFPLSLSSTAEGLERVEVTDQPDRTARRRLLGLQYPSPRTSPLRRPTRHPLRWRDRRRQERRLWCRRSPRFRHCRYPYPLRLHLRRRRSFLSQLRLPDERHLLVFVGSSR